MTSSISIFSWLPRVIAAAVLGGFFLSAPAYGQIEIESDPLAYVLRGYSGHLAYVAEPARISVGVFGVDVPAFFHGNETWDVRSSGITLKADYLITGQDGFFVGLDSGYQRGRYTLPSTGETKTSSLLGAGVRTGYRFFLGNTGLYAVPWISLSYQFGAEDVMIGEETFEQGRLMVFPAVHVGWRF